MKIHRDHGAVLSSVLSARGATILQQSGVLFMAAYHGVDLPLDGYEIRSVERAARDVLNALDAYDRATATADPVITWPRPIYHRQATGIPTPLVTVDATGMGTASTRFDVLPDRVIPLARLDAIQGDDGPEEAA